MCAVRHYNGTVPPEPAHLPIQEISSLTRKTRSGYKPLIAGLCLLTGVSLGIHRQDASAPKTPILKRADSKPNQPSHSPPAALYKKSPTRTGYAEIVRKAARSHRVEPRLIAAIIHVESGGNRLAVSPRGAKGLMQLMPVVCKKYGVRDPFDMEQNITAGTAHFSSLLGFFGGDTELALAAYHCGLKRVIENNGVPPGLTQKFIRKIFDRYEGPVVCRQARTNG